MQVEQKRSSKLPEQLQELRGKVIKAAQKLQQQLLDSAEQREKREQKQQQQQGQCIQA